LWIGIALDNVAAEIGMGLAWGTALSRAAKKPDQRDRNPDRRCLHMLADLPLDLSFVSERHWGLCLVQKRDDTGRVTVP